MAVIWIEPYITPPGGFAFPAGVAGGFAQTDSTTRSTTTLYPVGTLARDASGNEYMYVKAGASIAVNSPVVVNADLTDVRACSAVNQGILGVADAAFASGDNGFIMIRGTTNAVTAGSVAVGTLMVSAAAGALGSGAATDIVSRGIVILVNSATPQKVRLM